MPLFCWLLFALLCACVCVCRCVCLHYLNVGTLDRGGYRVWVDRGVCRRALTASHLVVAVRVLNACVLAMPGRQRRIVVDRKRPNRAEQVDVCIA